MYKFEKLEVWNLALEYLDLVYLITERLPRDEDFNLKSQMRRAVTSIALNIAEGSTGQTDSEQARFLGHAIRSLTEIVACLRIIARRGYLIDKKDEFRVEDTGLALVRKLQAMRNVLDPTRKWARETAGGYAHYGSGSISGDMTSEESGLE